VLPFWWADRQRHQARKPCSANIAKTHTKPGRERRHAHVLPLIGHSPAPLAYLTPSTFRLAPVDKNRRREAGGLHSSDGYQYGQALSDM
jgi:hypothetical protein